MTRSVAKEIFSNYPVFSCSLRVTLGTMVVPGTMQRRNEHLRIVQNWQESTVDSRKDNTLGLDSTVDLIDLREGTNYRLFPTEHFYVDVSPTNRMALKNDVTIRTRMLENKNANAGTAVETALTITSDSFNQTVIVERPIGKDKFPSRIEFTTKEDRVKIEFSNVTFKLPEAHLFEIPEGYEKLEWDGPAR